MGIFTDKTVDHFMSLLIAGKHLEAQDMLGKDMRGLAGLLGGVSNDTLNPYYRSGAFTSYTLTLLEKTDNSVRYKVIAVTSDGVAHEDFVDLVRDEGEWKISRFLI